jgi:hypothetical protein
LAQLIVSLIIIALGAAFSFKARGVRDWIERRYDSPRITRHVHMRGYLLSIRLVGIGWLAFGLFILSGVIAGPNSN